MKSLVLYGFNDLRIEEVPYPKLRPGWVLTKTKVVQPSITEVLLSRGVPTLGLDLIKRILEAGPSPIFGHELCGEVIEVGGGVRRLQKGDRVSAIGKVACGSCELCRTGRKQQCRSGLSISYGIPGSRFAEYAAIPEDALLKVPDNVSDNEAAAAQPLSDCVASVATANLRIGDSVAVLGQGSMGLSTMQVARASGAGLIVTTDVREESLRISSELGADEALDASKVDPVERVLRLTDGEGVDVVFEASGGSRKVGLSGSSSHMQAFRMAKNSGRVVQIALFDSPIELDLSPSLRDKGVRYLFPEAGTLQTLEHALRLVSTGLVKIRPLVTHVLHGLDKVPEAFEITANKSKYHAINPAQVVA